MCAIAGLVNLTATPQICKTMLETMQRRGPDGQGRYENRQTILLHTRLAIIDPDGGIQPMTLEWAGERYCLTYNGELYNTEELKAELQKLGHQFSDHSDTEVLLHSYAQWGADCVKRLNGIFAFGVWEEIAGRLFLARDRIGVKPLFYKLHEGGFIFASEIKTILSYPTVKAQLDMEGAAQLILLGPGRMPGSGVFRGICEIEPGWAGYYSNGKLELRQYWKLLDRPHTDSLPDTVEKVRWLVTDSIKRQMVSDVPIGTFLSGGLDSSIISAVCAGVMEKEGEALPTFSVDYLNNQQYFRANKFQPDADDVYIRLMQKHIGSRHHWTVLTPEVLLYALEDATIARDLPGMADVDFSLLAFCREIRSHVKVALSGECADEIFGGYPWYRDPMVRNANGFPWAQNTSIRAMLLTTNISIHAQDYVMASYEKTCKESDILPEASSLERRMKEMMNLNFRWFMQTLLDRKDRMSMYSGLEVRVPFCDYRIAEYLYSVPWEFKDYHGREKGLLRCAAESILPEKVLYRKKSPYPKTFDPHYTAMAEARLKQIMEKKEEPLFYLLNKEGINLCLQESSPWPWYGQLMQRPQIIAYLLQIAFWLKYYHVELLF